jgi:predicted P-loop ATPase
MERRELQDLPPSLARALPGSDLPEWAQNWWRGGYLLLIPLYDVAGEMRSFMARRVTGDSGPKSLPPRGYTLKGLCMLSPGALAAVRAGEGFTSPLIVEGEPDFLTWSKRHSEVIGVRAGAWTDRWAEHVHEGAELILRLHQDAGGRQYATRISRTLPRAKLLKLCDRYDGDENDRLQADDLPVDPREGCEPWAAPPPPDTRGHEPHQPPGTMPTRERHYAEAGLKAECDRVTSAPDHGVNDMLNAAAYSAGRFCKGPGAPLTESEVKQALEDAARSRGHAASSIRATIKSGLEAALCWPGLPASSLELDQRLDDRAKRRRKRRRSLARKADREEIDLDLLLDSKGEVKVCQLNVSTVLQKDPRWQAVVAWDAPRARVITVQRPPWTEAEQGEDHWTEGQEWTDVDDVRLRQWITREHGFEPRRDDVGAAIQITSLQRIISPVRDYLQALKWDGVPRIHAWLQTYTSARTLVAPETYLERVGIWWLVSAVARALSPGSKVDHCLVLEGRQGTGKSTCFRTLCADPAWFTDSEPAIGSKDAFITIAGSWIVELAELEGITGKRAHAALRHFLTAAVDKFRPPYGKRTVSIPRMSVFAATVNPNEYLQDPEGNRRYWPVATGHIDIPALARDRDQIWAEAVHWYHQGCRWWPETREEVQWCTMEQDARLISDPWEEAILRYLETSTHQHHTADSLLQHAIRIETSRVGRSHGARVNAIMAGLGWRKVRRRVAGKQLRVFVKDE